MSNSLYYIKFLILWKILYISKILYIMKKLSLVYFIFSKLDYNLTDYFTYNWCYKLLNYLCGHFKEKSFSSYLQRNSKARNLTNLEQLYNETIMRIKNKMLYVYINIELFGYFKYDISKKIKQFGNNKVPIYKKN